MIRKKTYAEISEEIREALETNTDLSALGAGSTAGSLVDIIAQRLAEIYGDMELNSSMLQASTARGFYLDLKAEEFGLKRIEEQPAIVYESDRILKFYCTVGVLRDYLAAGYVPSGTEVYNSDQTKTYRVTEDFYFSDTDNEVYVTAGATTSGADHNVGKGELEAHSLGAADVLVTNTAAIQNGAAVESNDNLRFRLANAPLLLATSNVDALKTAVSVVPGVSDILVVPYDQGVGSVGIKIIPTSNVLTEDLSDQVAVLAGAARAAGDYLHVIGPEYCGVEISVLLIFVEGVSEGDKKALVVPVENAIMGYLAELRMGQPFILNELLQRCMEISESILDLEIKCYSFRGRPQVIRNFHCYPEEVYVPQVDVEHPVTAYF
jgi:uncharacterized phage protein gp47/JayE